jgi:RNA polymerase sigma-70 factor (ECF subfamily)
VLLDGHSQPASIQATSDQAVAASLLGGDEAALVALVKRHHWAMIGLARLHLQSEALAEEVVQDCWLVILRRLGKWTGRGSLRSWIFGIVANQARSRAVRESRMVPLSTLLPDDGDGCSDHVFAGFAWQWPEVAPVDNWSHDLMERQEVLDTIRAAIEALPPRQRAVITLRDVSGCDGQEACAALHISEANQRVLLHRARSRVRSAVEEYLRG